MEAKIIDAIPLSLIEAELTEDRFLRDTNKGGNKIYIVNANNAPNVMREIGRLREIAFRAAGGGTGKDCDIDEFDTMNPPCQQLVVWDPDSRLILGGYRFIIGTDIKIEDGKPRIATSHMFNFSQKFIDEYLPYTLELGRSFVRTEYQSSREGAKALFALDNLWDGLGALTVVYPQMKYFFGKVTMYTTYNFRARNLLLYFLKKYFQDKDALVKPVTPLECDIDNPAHHELFEGLDYKEGYKVLQKELKNNGEHIPPLINSYMNLSPTMKVFGTAINHGFGGVEETGILVSIPDIYPEKIERYITPVRLWVHRIRVRWWNRKQD